MSDELPSIPQIVRALTTLSDRHSDALKAQQVEHERELKTERERKDTLDNALLSRDCLVEELEKVISTLCTRIERTQEQLKRDNQQCVYSEPLELMNLLGRTTDPSALISKARESAREAKRKELERQEAEKAKPVFSDPLCRVCGHIEDRHTEELPEEGGENYCTDCSGTAPFAAPGHTFDGARPADWDVCRCGHARREHVQKGTLGSYCNDCRPLQGRKHEFALRR